MSFTDDEANCGSCGNECATGATCVAGACECSSGQVACAGACVDLQADESSCGACGTACASGATCLAGSCFCPGTQQVCGGACVELATDLGNCGTCGTVCAVGGSCFAGACSCRSGHLACGGTCLDVQSDESNCGECGVSCAIGATCRFGECVCPGSDALICAGECVLPLSDESNCGTCGTTCGVACAEAECAEATSLQVRGNHRRALMTNNRLAEWGDRLIQNEPVFEGIPDMLEFVMSDGTSGVDRLCGIFAPDRALRCRETNFFGSTPFVDTGFENVVQVAMGASRTCLIDAAGAVRCLGSGAAAGVPSGENDGSVPIALPDSAVSLATGESFTCAVLANGQVWCWGLNPWGQLGNDPALVGSTATPVRAGSIDNALSIWAGLYATCAVLNDGQLSCWGRNLGGILGDGSTTDRWMPLVVPALTNVTQASMYVRHACARRSDGSLRCWGSGTSGQLGDGTSTSALFATAVPTMPVGAIEVSVGWSHTCAVDTAGDVWCWGHDGDGMLGQAGSSASSSIPRKVDW